MIKINAHLDAQRFVSTAREMAYATRRALTDVLQQQGKIAAKEFVNIMPPMVTLTGEDTFNEQRHLGLAAVESDVRHAYAVIDDVYDDIQTRHPQLADPFWKDAKTGKFDEARQLVQQYADSKFKQAKIGPFDRGVYDRYRSKNTGRIHIKKYPRHIVTDPAALTAFIKMLQARVGILKAGSLVAAWAAGFAITVPVWISHHRGSGRGEAQLAGPKPYIELSNTTPYADKHNQGNRLVTAVLGNRTRAMERMLESSSLKAWENSSRAIA